MSQNLSHPRIVAFHDPDYPNACSDATLTRLIPGEFQVARASDLADKLTDSCDLFISFHGPYFPKQAWTAIQQFLTMGGNLAIFGGIPLTRPVLPDGTIEAEQQAYTDLLYLGPFFQLDLPTADLHLIASRDAAFLEQSTFSLPAEQQGTFWSFYPKLTQVSDHPEDMGSAGPLDTILTPLLFANADMSGIEQPLATPALLLDQQHGRFKGGRWLLSPWQPSSEDIWLAHAVMIHQLILLAAEGSVMFDVRPLLACYQPGEAPSLVISSRVNHDLHVHVTVYTPQDEELASFEIEISGAASLQESRRQLPVQTTPGLYRIETYYKHSVLQRQETGFWVWGEEFVKSTDGKRLTAGRDYFYQDGRPFFVFGTTYMDSRVQRKYLSLPNPARWDADFAEMKRSGINLIRTGLWTAWRDVMPDVGVANEAILRALDAFVMTACKYNIQVIFTFFAFFPPLFEGENPWLDPRSIEGQQDFVTTFARRYASIQLVSWDLINEPSFGDPKTIFSPRPLPNYDHFERKAFQQWLTARYTIPELQVRWRQTPADFSSWDEITLPVTNDYHTNSRNTNTRQMLKVMDYTYFSQEMFCAWAVKMREAIRSAGSSTLVGVGQDESGARLSPQFYASSVDYTTTHPWWNNDDLFWDMLLDKTLETPNLIQEIGVMLVRDVDMRPWRSEQECANLLERKLITGLGARSAGLIQWLWHTNANMTSDNENSIGLGRADGSAKPELTVMLEIGRLVQALAARVMEPTTTPDIWVVAPYSQWFLRPELAIEATRQAIRVLGYDFGIVPQVVGEHLLAEISCDTYHPRYIILPGTQTFTRKSWDALLKFVEKGTTILVSGALSHDQHNLVEDFCYWDEAECVETVPVSRYERLIDQAGENSQLVFGNDKIGYVRKAHNQLKVYQRGSGKIFWSGLPLELSGNAQATRSVYAQVLGIANQDIREDSPLLVVRQPLKDGRLVLLVSESSDYQEVTLNQDAKIKVAPNRAGAVIMEDDGHMQLFGGVCHSEE